MDDKMKYLEYKEAATELFKYMGPDVLLDQENSPHDEIYRAIFNCQRYQKLNFNDQEGKKEFVRQFSKEMSEMTRDNNRISYDEFRNFFDKMRTTGMSTTMDVFAEIEKSYLKKEIAKIKEKKEKRTEMALNDKVAFKKISSDMSYYDSKEYDLNQRYSKVEKEIQFNKILNSNRKSEVTDMIATELVNKLETFDIEQQRKIKTARQKGISTVELYSILTIVLTVALTIGYILINK